MSLSEMLGELEKRITAFFAGLTGQENTNTAHTLPHKESPFPHLTGQENTNTAHTLPHKESPFSHLAGQENTNTAHTLPHKESPFPHLAGQENTNTAHTLPHKESPPWLSDDLNKSIRQNLREVGAHSFVKEHGNMQPTVVASNSAPLATAVTKDTAKFLS